tara:strand:+ start:189 stop:761 length:573 start_codon:yes stop_codon:yes gene_type:complete
VANFVINKTPIKDLMQGEIISKKDGRGYFERVFCLNEFKENFKLKKNIIQINRSLSKIKGTIRGCHFQFQPYAETKVVSCCNGSLFDVGIDLRKGSETYLQYFSQILTSENKKFLVIPEGFAHGFQTLKENTEILYLVTEKFSLEHDNGINPFDPEININWPIPCTIRSEKDTKRKFIKDRNFKGIELFD